MTLTEGLVCADITYAQLWSAYLALGGNAGAADLRHFVGAKDRPQYEHNLIAQALNESLMDQGSEIRVAYRGLFRLPTE